MELNTVIQKNAYPIFGIYEKALRPQCFAKMFDDALSCGYQSFELSLDCTNARLARLDWSQKEISEVLAQVQRSGIQMLSTCLSGHKRYPLGSSDPAIVEQGLCVMQKAIDLCGALGIRVIQLSGFDVYNREKSTLETQKRYVENLEKCVRMAERACVMLAIEPVEGNLLGVRDTMQVVHQIDSCWLQIYPDVANINSLGIDPIAEIPYGKGHIVAVHMRDSLPNDFSATLSFGTGQLDFLGVFRVLSEIGYVGPLIVEMWNEERANYKEYITQARTYMERCIDQVRQEKNV